jgi:hypothetical protein
VRGFLLGLLSHLPRINGWTIAGHVGDASPDRMQYLLRKAVWDTDGVREGLRCYVTLRRSPARHRGGLAARRRAD